jgi:putative restriction endonuclease
VKGSHKSAFCYLVQAKTKAYDGGEKWAHWREQGWKWACDYKILYEFENPVGFKDLKQRDSEFKEWDAYKRNNFQGTSFDIPEDIWNKLDQIASEKNPGYPGYRKFIAVPASSSDIKMDFTAREYASAFNNLHVAPHHLQMLLSNYYAPNRTLTATMMAKAMGYDYYGASNLHYGKLGGLVGEKLGWNPLPKFKVNVLVDFKKPDDEWLWIMKPAVAEAIELLGWTEDTPTIPEEVDEIESVYEGAVRRVSVNAYERSKVAREKCLLHYGCKCTVCGIILSDIYGEIAQGYIHVHHLRQLSEINSEYQIDPIADLRPVCPTCHSIIHLRAPPYSVEEVQILIKSNKGV